MHPVLFEGPFGWTANGYGTLILIGALLTVPGIVWDARRRGLPGIFVLDAYIATLIGSFLGGELLFLITQLDHLAATPNAVALRDAIGFVFYGSIFGMFGGMVWVARKYERPTGEVVDYTLTWGMPVHIFGRLGCYMAGCCWGAPTGSEFGLQFPEAALVFGEPSIEHLTHASGAVTTVPLHPVQLYEAAGLTVIAILLVARRLRSGVGVPWSQTAWWAISYGVLRGTVEVFRADPDRRRLFELEFPGFAQALSLPAEHPILLSTSQAVALWMAVWGVVALWRLRGRQPGQSSSAPQ